MAAGGASVEARREDDRLPDTRGGGSGEEVVEVPCAYRDLRTYRSRPKVVAELDLAVDHSAEVVQADGVDECAANGSSKSGLGC